VVLKPSP